MKVLYSDNHSQLYVCQVMDNLYDLAHFFCVHTETIVNEAQRKFKSRHRQHEWLTTRAMLCEIFGELVRVGYNDAGKPYLVDNPMNISISHSKTHVAILLSDLSCVGVDIEQISERIIQLESRIAHSSELPINFVDYDTNLKASLLTALWTAKEAVYKSLSNQNLDLLTDISVCLQDGNGFPEVALVKGDTPITLNPTKLEDNICTFVAY